MPSPISFPFSVTLPTCTVFGILTCKPYLLQSISNVISKLHTSSVIYVYLWKIWWSILLMRISVCLRAISMRASYAYLQCFITCGQETESEVMYLRGRQVIIWLTAKKWEHLKKSRISWKICKYFIFDNYHKLLNNFRRCEHRLFFSKDNVKL